MNLTKDEQKIYDAILAGHRSVKELSQVSKIPIFRIGEVLQSLVRKNLISEER